MPRKTTKRVRKITKQPRASDYQTLPQRIKWLRVRQKPYMTQQQLAHIAGVDIKSIVLMESDKRNYNVELNTLRKVAHALGCRVFINIKSKPCQSLTECQISNDGLPPLPKRTGKTSDAGLLQAELHGRSYWRNYRRGPRRKPRITTSEIEDLAKQPVDVPE